MQKNKIKLIIFLLIVSLLLISCKRTDVQTKVITSFRTGTQGLELKFLDNAPPKEVYYTDKTQVPIGLFIQNKGAEKAYGVVAFNFDGFKGLVKESLDSNLYYGEDLLRISSSEGSFLEGKRVTNPNGDLMTFTVIAEPSPLNPQAEQFKSTIIATACYDYATEFTPEVCIDTDIFDTKPIAKACKVKDVVSSGGQGAPVSIEKVEVQMLPSGKGISPYFVITLRNVGKGEVIRFGQYKEICSQKSSSEPNNFNIVRVSAFLAGKETARLDCLPKRQEIIKEGSFEEEGLFGYARLRDKIATVTCKYQGELPKTSGNYISKLRILAEYGYTESISKDVLIKVPVPKK